MIASEPACWLKEKTNEAEWMGQAPGVVGADM